MALYIRLMQFVGGLVFLVGVIGVFVRISGNDGALAIAGSVVFASGVVAQTLAASDNHGPPRQPSEGRQDQRWAPDAESEK